MKSPEQELARYFVRAGAVAAEQRDLLAARLESLEGDAPRALKELDVPLETAQRLLAQALPLEFPETLTPPPPAELAWALDVERLIAERHLYPYGTDERGYVFALANVFLTSFQEQLELVLGRPVRFVWCDPDTLASVFEGRAPAAEAEAVVTQVDAGESTEGRESPIVKAVNLLFLDALNDGASDIHVEPFERQLQVRFRVDGVLRLVKTFPVELQAAILSRIKLMAGMDISERRVPQDGRIKFQILGADYDMRVSTLPSVHGETAVLRLLKKESVNIDLGTSGFRPEALAQFRSGFQRAHGICLVTGPTGSGKTTTLYGAVNEINDVERKIFTIEDPVEYQLEGIVQIPVHAKVGMTFAAGLRAALRQDPDIIMIGEIRDGETAEIAVKSALTGHLVLATLHTNSAPGAISRLLDMGTESFMLASTLEVVLAQRLQRRICSGCRDERPLTASDAALFRAGGMEPPKVLFAGKGCERCGGSGYKGRLGIHEVLTVDDRIRAAMTAGVSEVELTKLCVEGGMVDLRRDSLIKVAEGSTTAEECARVIGGGEEAP